MNELLPINRFATLGCAFCKHESGIGLTAINNACLLPCAALFIFSPYTEHNVCRKNSIYHLQEYY